MKTISTEKLPKVFVIGFLTLIGVILAGIILDTKMFVTLFATISVLFNLRTIIKKQNHKALLYYIPHTVLIICLAAIMYYPDSLIITSVMVLSGVGTILGTLTDYRF